MGDLLAKFPGARRALFKRYHLGGCASCGFQEGETLEQVCARNGNLPVTEVIAYLEESQNADDALMVSASTAQAMTAAGEAVLIDIRTREEFEAVHVAGSLFFSQQVMGQVGQLASEKTVLFLCHRGDRSLDAAAYFAGHGVERVRAVRGGIDAWSMEVDPDVPRYTLGE
jgi:rhodanese-related sulfurtransferase